MPDDKSKRGKPDRDRIAANEPYELYYEADKLDMATNALREILDRVGPMRSPVEAATAELDRAIRTANRPTLEEVRNFLRTFSHHS